MIDHTGIGVANVAASASFYDAALGALGMRRAMQMPEGEGTDGVGYGLDYPIFWIDRFHPHSTQQHTAFVANSPAEVVAFHAAALRAGGKDNGAPERAKINPLQPIAQRLYSTPTETTSRRYFGAADAFQWIGFGEVSGQMD
jgi:catechol 2,3-dioxygenase-like lactoylglutathione lyase family enzyme